jgi:uncharacterized protein (DUF924 family)
MKAYPKMMSQLLAAHALIAMPLFLQAQVPLNQPILIQPAQTQQLSIEPKPPITPSISPPGVEIKTQSNWTKSPQLPEKAVDILDFWFGFLPGPDFFPTDKVSIWFVGTPDVDRQILDNFSQDILNAMRGDYNSWRETPRGRLALILLLDQFPRHVYRNQPHEFIADRMAQALVLEGLQKGDDKHLYPIERAFFYLPLEHSEDLQLQALSVASYRQLLAESPENIQPQLQAFLQFAILHQQQILRFGRFPYRNAILGRESTPEEVVFINQWGKPSF